MNLIYKKTGNMFSPLEGRRVTCVLDLCGRGFSQWPTKPTWLPRKYTIFVIKVDK